MRAALPGLLLLALTATVLTAAEDAPSWAREAASQTVPDYPSKVNSVVLLQEEMVTVDADGRRVMRERGAIIHESRDIIGVTDVVCPIIAGDGRAVACVTVAAVSRRSAAPNFEAMLARLKLACAEIAHELGG